MHQPKRQAQDAERGQALVEFALTVPILLMLVFGIIDLARLIFAYTQVIDAARNGVRYGIVEGLDAGNVQYLDCYGIEAAAQNTVGLVPGDAMDVTVSYLNLQDNDATPLAQCGVGSGPSFSTVKDGAVLAVKVEGEITPLTPVLAMFDNSIHFDYTAKRAIAKSAAYTDEWPTAPQVPKNFRSQPDCANGRVYFFWDPLSSWPDRIEIRDSFTGMTVQAIDYPETQYAYCKDNDPYAGRVCGVDIDPNGGYGMWYVVVIQDDLEGTTSFDATASCTSGGGPGPGSNGTVSFSGLAFHDKNSNGRQGGNEDGLGGVKITLRAAGGDGALWTADDVVKTAFTNVLGEFTFTGSIPVGKTTEQFVIDVTIPATYHIIGESSYTFLDMADKGSGSATFALAD